MNAGTQLVNVSSLGSQARLLDYHNWIPLNPGGRVIVRRPACPPEHGTIDDIAGDASYFWIWIDGHSRILISNGDGTIIHKILT